MTIFRTFLAAASAILLIEAAAPAKPYGRAPSAALSPFAQAILDLHNRERARLGVPPLRWDPTIEAGALAHARQLAGSNSLAHSSRTARSNQGENLSMGMRGWSPRQMMDNWLKEKRDFIPGIFPDVSRTGEWSSAAHYSQMVWAGTTSLGCGQAAGVQFEYLVCRYAPAGNIDGMPAIPSPCSRKSAAAAPAEPRLASQQPAPGTQVCI